MEIEFDELVEFRKDIKRLGKRYRSLPEDLKIVKMALRMIPDADPTFSFKIEGLKLKTVVIKVRKISCKSLKTRGVNSGLRLVYAYFIEDSRIVFIELYHKSDKAMENRERIYKYFR